MRTWREAHAFALVMLLISGVAATVTMSCGGGSDGESDGTLCQQCGDTDGPCRPTVVIAADRADEFPAFCADERAAGESCTVELRCLRKLDSSQRRCFPADPATNALDLRYECDGARPNPSINPTTTATPEPTATSTVETPTPESTGPTPTSATPTATGPTPEATATPDDGEETAAVDIDVETDDDEFPASFTVTVTYPAAKGSFLADGAVDCSADVDGVTFQDAGSGTLTITFAGDPEETFFTASCDFHQAAGQTLVDGDLVASASAGGVVVTVGDIF